MAARAAACTPWLRPCSRSSSTKGAAARRPLRPDRPKRIRPSGERMQAGGRPQAGCEETGPPRRPVPSSQAGPRATHPFPAPPVSLSPLPRSFWVGPRASLVNSLQVSPGGTPAPFSSLPSFPGPSRWDSSLHFFQGPTAADGLCLSHCNPLGGTPAQSSCPVFQVSPGGSPMPSSVLCPLPLGASQNFSMFSGLCPSISGDRVYLSGSLEGKSPAFLPLLQSL